MKDVTWKQINDCLIVDQRQRIGKKGQHILLENISLIYADGTFGGAFKREIKDKYGVNVEIPKEPIAKKGNMGIHPKR